MNSTEGEAAYDLPVLVLQPRELSVGIHREEVWRRESAVQGLRPDVPNKHQLYVTESSGSLVRNRVLIIDRPVRPCRCLRRLDRCLRRGSERGSSWRCYREVGTP